MRVPLDEPPPPSVFGRFLQAVRSDWRGRARPAQIPPDDFSVFLELGGRGSGKTWSAANYVHEQAACGGSKRIALIGATASDARFTMVEGASGILAVAPAEERPEWEPGKGQLTWPSGAIARAYSSDSPDLLRGPEHDLAWADELAAWRRADETWSNLMLGLRGGAKPRVVVTTTPRPVRLVRELVARNGQDGVVVRRTSTYDNRDNLPPSFFAQLVKKFEGTRLARQELLAELLEDVPGALWSRDVLEETRVDEQPEELERIVVAVDPAGSTSEGADETGIVVCALGVDGHGYVLADLSGRYAPTEWGRKAVAAFHSRKADAVVIEKNFGGDMAAATIAAVDSTVPVKAVTSSRGKVLRAEPISSLFEQRRAHMVGSHSALEDQMCAFTSDWDRRRDGSPDRVDAMVFALTELLLQERPGGFLREESLLAADAEGVASPVSLPEKVERIFAAACISETEPDALAAVYFAVARDGAKVFVLDWDLAALEQDTLDAFFLGSALRLQEFADSSQSRNRRAPLLLEPTGLGAMLLEQGQFRHCPVAPLVDEELLSKDATARIIAASSYLASGAIKLTKPAHAKRATFRAVHRNHLLAEIASFRLGEPKVSALLTAFATGALDALSGKQALNTWLRLQNPGRTEPTSLADSLKPPAGRAPGRSAASELPEDPEVLRMMNFFAFDRTNPVAVATARRGAEKQLAKARAQAAEIAREQDRLRAAAADRERREGLRP
jgi:phage terminase large subunit-like protein